MALSNKEYTEQRDKLDAQLNNHEIGQTQYDAEVARLNEQLANSTSNDSSAEQVDSSTSGLLSSDDYKKERDTLDARLDSHTISQAQYDMEIEALNQRLNRDEVKTVTNQDNFAQAVKPERVAEILGVDPSLVIDDLNMTPLEKEQNVYTKTDLSDVPTVIKDISSGRRLDYVRDGENKEWNGCVLTTKTIDGKSLNHVESAYLGSFDYDPDEFALGYKTLEDGSQLPLLQYIGKNNGANDVSILGLNITSGVDIFIPEGIKNIDYMFNGNQDINYVPYIPESVTSMHYTFGYCHNLQSSPYGESSIGGNAALSKQDSFWNSYVYLPDVNAMCVYLPPNVEDLSGAFKGCENLDVAFAAYDKSQDKWYGAAAEDSKLPTSVKNITAAWDGCESMDKSHFWSDLPNYPEYGKGITPYLTSVYAKDALNVSSEEAKKYADTAEFTVDEKGKVAEDVDTSELDKQQLQEAQVATRLDYLEDIHDGKVDNDASLASGGARSNNYYYNAKDDAIRDDVTGLVKSDDKPDAMSVLWQRAAIDGAVGLGIGTLVGTKFKNGIVGLAAGAAGAIALDYFDILPESLVPMMRWVEDKLPDGAIKTKLHDFIGKIAPSNIDEQMKNLTAENVAATHQNRRLQRSLFGVDGNYELDDISKSLYNNAEYCGKNLNFKATVDVALEQGEAKATDGARAVVHESVDSLEELWEQKAENGEDMTESIKNMKDYYVELMEGLAEYDKGAKAGIVTLEKQSYRDVSYQGLEMLNRAYTDEVLTSLKKMDAEYHFMDEEAWSKIEKLDIKGVDIENARNWDSSKLQALSEASIMESQNIITAAGEDYVKGIVQYNRDNESYWNSGSGKFYNEDFSDETVSDNREKAEQEQAKKDQESSTDKSADNKSERETPDVDDTSQEESAEAEEEQEVDSVL